jgi:hypothetical protein
VIEESVIAGMDGYQSRSIDFPCGGSLIVRNSTIQHGQNADNTDLISVGTEPRSCRQGVQPSNVVLRNNWIVIDRDRSSDERSRDHGPTAIFNWRAPVKRIDVVGNRIVEPTGELKFSVADNLPDMLDQNTVFGSRQAAGLDADQIPSVILKATGK